MQREHIARDGEVFVERLAIESLAAAGDSAGNRDLTRSDQRGEVGDVTDISQNAGNHQAETLAAIRLVGDVAGERIDGHRVRNAFVESGRTERDRSRRADAYTAISFGSEPSVSARASSMRRTSHVH